MALFSNQIELVLGGYSQAKREKLAGHRMGRTLRRDLPETIRAILEQAGIGDELLPFGSAGQGRWANIPWVAVFHSRETTTALEGKYVVYLFSSDMSAAYLTLNQGVTKAEPKDIVSTGETVRSVLGDLVGFQPGPLPTGSLTPPRTEKPHGYEVGCIYYKRYDRGQIPDDHVLQRDLLALVQAYASYVEGHVVDLASTQAAEDETDTAQADLAPKVSEVWASDELRRCLIERVRQLSPTAFERLLGKLWHSMGYRDVKVTGRPSDRGVDGEFKVPLVDVSVMFQAKRFAANNLVGPADIRQLKGTVVGRYDLGIFVTTSSYTPGAREEAQAAGPPKVVLIDSDRLVDLLLDAHLGLKSVVERAAIDDDVFAALETP